MKNTAIFLFAAIGLMMVGAAAAKIGGTILFLRLARTAAGTVVRYKTAHSNDGRKRKKIYCSIAEFVPVGGIAADKIQITSTTASRPPAHQIGEQVTIRYLPKSPRAGRIQSFWELWAFPMIIVVVGLMLIGVALTTYHA